MGLPEDSRAAFIEVLTTGGVKFVESADGTIRVSWNATPVDFHQRIRVVGIRDDIFRVDVHLSPALPIPETLRDEVAVFMNRLNWDTVMGDWELDPRDGQVVFRLSFASDRVVSARMAHHYLSLSQWQYNRTAPYLMRMLNDGFSAAQAHLDYLTQDLEFSDVRGAPGI